LIISGLSYHPPELYLAQLHSVLSLGTGYTVELGLIGGGAITAAVDVWVKVSVVADNEDGEALTDQNGLVCVIIAVPSWVPSGSSTVADATGLGADAPVAVLDGKCAAHWVPSGTVTAGELLGGSEAVDVGASELPGGGVAADTSGASIGAESAPASAYYSQMHVECVAEAKTGY